MPLVDLDLSMPVDGPPEKVEVFLRDAVARIERFVHEHRDQPIPGFVPSDFHLVYSALKAVVETNAAPGNAFCEWGSGLGVIACLAAMLDYDACGIEIESALVEKSRRLAEDFELHVDFATGSFIPPGGERFADVYGEFGWLITSGGDGHEELALGPEDFDVIFAYPWPSEEHVIENLFEHYAAVGAVLITYHGYEDLRIRRKTFK